MDEADRIWEEKDYTAEKILETHRRTPYPKKKISEIRPFISSKDLKFVECKVF